MGGEQGESGKSIVLDRGLGCGLGFFGLVRLVYDGVYRKLIITFSANFLPSCRPVWVRGCLEPRSRTGRHLPTHTIPGLGEMLFYHALTRPPTRDTTNLLILARAWTHRINLVSRALTPDIPALRENLQAYADMIRPYGCVLQIYIRMEWVDGLMEGGFLQKLG